MGNPWILLSASVLVLATDMDPISMDSTHGFLMTLTPRTSEVVQNWLDVLKSVFWLYLTR